MRIPTPCTRLHQPSLRLCAAITLGAILLGTLPGCGGGGGEAVQAGAQSLTVDATPSAVPLGTVALRAQASSGLAVSYRSMTDSICTVDAASGMVTTMALGTCTIQLTQSGNEAYAPAAPINIQFLVSTNSAQTIAFAAAHTLTSGGLTTVNAQASSGLPVAYISLTPLVCTVHASSGLVSSLGSGTCTVAANQAGSANYLPAMQSTQSLIVAVPGSITVPSAPAGVRVTAGNDARTVIVNATSVDSGGALLTSFKAVSVPAGMVVTGNSLPLTVTCPSTCAGHAFTLSAINAQGEGVASVITDIITRYHVRTTFYEPDTQPQNSIFTGSFTLNATTSDVTDLRGQLTESMTGSASGMAPLYDMVQLTLTNQMSSVMDGALGGRLVMTFRNSSTETFWTGTGGDGWTPEAGIQVGAIYHGFPTPANNPGNAYVRIFVNTTDPLAPLTQAQIDKLAYADCAPGGMMGAACMTGTSVAGYGQVGSMSGYPVAQTITKAD